MIKAIKDAMKMSMLDTSVCGFTADVPPTTDRSFEAIMLDILQREWKDRRREIEKREREGGP